MEQYANMVQNTIDLPMESYGKIRGSFALLANLTSQLRTSRGDLPAMAGIFRNIYADSDRSEDDAICTTISYELSSALSIP